MRSAKAPTISAGVMTAKVIWKAKKRGSGIVPSTEAEVTPLRKALPRPPTRASSAPGPEVKDRL